MPSNIRVLLVDDNPMVLEMLRQAMASFSTVQPLTDGGDALLKAIDEKPDLIITDFAMGGMDGRQLLQKIKARSATAGIPVILMASKADISEKLKALQDTVEDFIEKPFFVKEAAARIKKVVDKISLEKMAREAPGESVLRGNLAQMNALDLLQSLDMGRKTCALTLSNTGRHQSLHFHSGLGSCCSVRTDLHAIFAYPGGHINERQWQRMAHWYQLGCPFCRANPCNSGYFQGIPLRILGQRPKHLRLHGDKGGSLGFPARYHFGGDIHHRRATGGVVVGKLRLLCRFAWFCHLRSFVRLTSYTPAYDAPVETRHCRISFLRE